ncbi:MAG TPA: phosphatidate cytidylyltransferase [Phenylobacterium sp.]
MTCLPPARRFDWSNLGVRVVSALVLVPAVLWAVGAEQDRWFLLLVSIGVALLAIEWGGMSAPRAPVRVSAAVTVAVLASVFLTYQDHTPLAWIAMIIGSAAAALIARGVAERPADAAFGVVYIAIPCLCLVWLRSKGENGPLWTYLLFAVTWAADIFAFVVGSALKGPKLWPRFSPNKTWSGFVGGLLGAMLVGAGFVQLATMGQDSLFARFPPLGLPLAAAALVGLLGGAATMAGDLWESMLKRRFGVKDSGDLIPGHGGLLDRVDGLMFAAVVMAAARLVDFGWAH